jgi:hypothetical protein
VSAARLDLTSFLDVLTIILLALLVAQRDADATAEAGVQGAVTELQRAAETLRDQRDDARTEAARLQTELNAKVAEWEDLLAAHEVLIEASDLGERLGGLSDAELAATEQLLSQAITVVYFELRGDAVVSHRRLGESAPHSLEAPVPLTRRVAAGDVAPTTEYVGDFFQRLAASLDNALVQRSAEDRVFYVFVDGDGLTSCAAMVGIRRELAALPQLVAMLPPTRCE